MGRRGHQQPQQCLKLVVTQTHNCVTYVVNPFAVDLVYFIHLS